MKKLFFINLLLVSAQIFAQNSNYSGLKTFFTSNLLNKNVYKTNTDLKVRAVYQDKNTLNNVPFSIKPDSALIISPSQGSFIRYKVLKTDPIDKSLYIRILPGSVIDSTKYKIVVDSSLNGTDPSQYIFKTDGKQNLNQSYLASSAIVGTAFILPVRFRTLDKVWDDISMNINVSYGFGWKFKLGNHPFRSHFISVIPYAFGFSSQKYFSRIEEGIYSSKTDQFALTYWAHGITYEYEGFNFGVFGGFDKMFGSQDDWVYNNKWWFGLGLGYKLFQN